MTGCINHIERLSHTHKVNNAALGNQIYQECKRQNLQFIHEATLTSVIHLLEQKTAKYWSANDGTTTEYNTSVIHRSTHDMTN